MTSFNIDQWLSGAEGTRVVEAVAREIDSTPFVITKNPGPITTAMQERLRDESPPLPPRCPVPDYDVRRMQAMRRIRASRGHGRAERYASLPRLQRRHRPQRGRARCARAVGAGGFGEEARRLARALVRLYVA